MGDRMDDNLRRFWLGLILVALRLTLAAAQADGERVEIALTASPGDTLSQIARRYGVSVGYIAAQNNLDSAAGLSVGQRLVLVFNRAGSDAATPTPAASLSEGEASLVPLDPGRRSGSDPFAETARVCFTIYADANKNGALDGGENPLSGGAIELRGQGGEIVASMQSGATATCRDDLPAGVFHVHASAPENHWITSAATLRLELRAGPPLQLTFGVADGMPPPAPPHTESLTEAPDAPETKSVLREMSGVFALGIAVLILAAGSILSLILNRRARQPEAR